MTILKEDPDMVVDFWVAMFAMWITGIVGFVMGWMMHV